MEVFTDNDKRELADALIKAMGKEQLGNKYVAEILGCTAGQVSLIKNPNTRKLVPKSVWIKLKEWHGRKVTLQKFIPYDGTQHIGTSTDGMDESVHVVVTGTFDPPTVKPTKSGFIPLPITGELPIEKGIPLPPPLSRTTRKIYPLEKMEAGDSFKVPFVKGLYYGLLQKRVSGAVAVFRRTHPEWEFIVRTISEEECVRCWRVK